MGGMGKAGGRGPRRKEAPLREAPGLGLGWLGGEGSQGGRMGPRGGGGGGGRRSRGGEDGGGEPGPGRYLSWVFIILGGSAQGGRRRRREWAGG